MKVKVVNYISVDFDTKEVNTVDNIHADLLKQFPEEEFYCFHTGEEKHRIEVAVAGAGEYYPGRDTMPNGDPGYPEEWEIEYSLYEEEIEEVIEKYVAEHDCIIDWHITSETEIVE